MLVGQLGSTAQSATLDCCRFPFNFVSIAHIGVANQVLGQIGPTDDRRRFISDRGITERKEKTRPFAQDRLRPDFATVARNDPLDLGQIDS